MIVDRLCNLSEYCPERVRSSISSILLNRDKFAIGEHQIDRRIIVKRVSVTTVDSTEALIEDHEHHIDIQIPLNATERMILYNREGAEPAEDYNQANDVTFYKRPGSKVAIVDIHPGYFIWINPNELHQPQITITAPYVLEKLVIKIDCSKS